MAKVELDACDKCGAVVHPDPKLGHRQGGRVEIRLGAESMTPVLCVDCKKPVVEWFDALRGRVEIEYKGAERGLEAQLLNLPRTD